ncbi:CHAD domain-containing protein [Deinobacterium chartae]|uniref:CHAD domain-containing protein n=1 Tax=Deinobacterium chartae TaxID=521158 RepID=A0A841I0G8_9DEIO|nr:CHAD domain-containing protein [Deinobacterium chartae]MBB6099281.1 CHAD domain-containing protein [Deinobacterium chartae]
MKWAKRLETYWANLEAGQPKAVHEVRKLTRRAQADLRAVGGPKKIQRAWRSLRRTIAPIRDWDAVGEHLRHGLEELGATEAELARFDEAWASERLHRWAYVILPAPPPPFEHPGDWRERVRETLKDDWQDLKREAKRVLESSEYAAWHEWRKHLKRYRYTLELVDDPPEELLDLLQALGRMQDAQVASEMLRDPATPVPDAYRDRLLAREAAATEQAAAQVRDLWKACKKSAP